MKPYRIRMTHSLITSYGLHKYMEVLKPPKATKKQMTQFHTDEYVQFLSCINLDNLELLKPFQQKCKFF